MAGLWGGMGMRDYEPVPGIIGELCLGEIFIVTGCVNSNTHSKSEDRKLTIQRIYQVIILKTKLLFSSDRGLFTDTSLLVEAHFDGLVN